MLVIFSLLVMFCIGLYFVLSTRFNDFIEVFGLLITAISGIGLTVVMITLPFAHVDSPAHAARYHAFKITLEDARHSGISIERAAIEHDIIEWNKHIATDRYWNSTIFDIFVPDANAELEFLK